MASRKAQKDAARERRLADERDHALRARRNRRLQMVGGVVVAAIVVVVVLVIVSSGGNGGSKAAAPGTAKAHSTAAAVDKLLGGIPQSGLTLGKPSAKVTLTEYGDLQCPVCADFARNAGDQLIDKDVRTGRVKIVYKAFPTATQDPNTFFDQQAAAIAAGKQGKGWNFIETFYRQQGQEGTDYVDTTFLNRIAQQATGLNFGSWKGQRFNPSYKGQVQQEQQAAQGLGIDATPAFVAAGPKSQTKPQSGALSYDQVESMIKSVQ